MTKTVCTAHKVNSKLKALTATPHQKHVHSATVVQLSTAAAHDMSGK